MTFAQLKTHTLERLDEDPTNPQSWTAAEVGAALNEAQMLLVLMTLCLETKTSITLAGLPFQNVLTQFSNWIAPLRLRQSGKIPSARIADLDALDSGWSGTAAGPTLKRYGSVGFGLLFFYPFNIAGTAEVVYANSPATLTADADVPAVPERTHPALVSYATYRLREKQGGSEFQAGLAGLAEFLDVAKALGNYVRERSLGQRYDTLPIELARMDVSRLVKLRKDLLPEKAKEQANG